MENHTTTTPPPFAAALPGVDDDSLDSMSKSELRTALVRCAADLSRTQQLLDQSNERERAHVARLATAWEAVKDATMEHDGCIEGKRDFLLSTGLASEEEIDDLFRVDVKVTWRVPVVGYVEVVTEHRVPRWAVDSGDAAVQDCINEDDGYPDYRTIKDALHEDDDNVDFEDGRVTNVEVQ